MLSRPVAAGSVGCQHQCPGRRVAKPAAAVLLCCQTSGGRTAFCALCPTPLFALCQALACCCCCFLARIALTLSVNITRILRMVQQVLTHGGTRFACRFVSQNHRSLVFKRCHTCRSPTDGETRMFYEIVISPGYTPEGLEVLKGKSKALRILEAKPRPPSGRSLRQVAGGWLMQVRALPGVAGAAGLHTRPPPQQHVLTVPAAAPACARCTPPNRALMTCRPRTSPSQW